MNCIQILWMNPGWQVQVVLGHQCFYAGPQWDDRDTAKWFAGELAVALSQLKEGKVLEVVEK